MYSEEISSSSVKHALNCAGLSSRSYVTDDGKAIIVGIQVPLSHSGGVQNSYGAGSDIRDYCHDVNQIVWDEDPDGSWRLTFVGNNFTASIGGNVTLPEGHDIHNDEHRPFIHQGNDEGRAEKVYHACIEADYFNIVSIIKTFSHALNGAVAELLRQGPGRKIIHISNKETYRELCPWLHEALPWTDTTYLPDPLRSTDGWVARPVREG